MAYAACENYSEAIENYDPAINLKSDYAIAYFNMANSLRLSDKLEKAYQITKGQLIWI